MLELDIELKPSKQFMLLFLFLILGGIAIILFSSFSGWNKLLLISLNVLYGILTLLPHSFFLSKQVVTRIVTDGEHWLVGINHQVIPIKILGESTVTKWVCILRYKQPNKLFKKALIIFNDSMEKDLYRRLLVALRCSVLV